MDISLETISLWQINGEFAQRTIITFLSKVLDEGDVVVFGAYEPTPQLMTELSNLGAVRRSHLPDLFTCFDLNRSEHPEGSAFEWIVNTHLWEKVLALPDSILRQADIPFFFDHVLAYRPGTPRVPLISFHDAACGGTLYISGLYSREQAEAFASSMGGTAEEVENPALGRRSE
jgi:hypothetical protein